MDPSAMNVVAAVLQGNQNLMGAYHALVAKFGVNAEAALVYVWGRVGKSGTANSKEPTWWSPDFKIEQEKQATGLWEKLPPVSLEDAADTVGRSILPEDAARDLYRRTLADYHVTDESRRPEMVRETIGNLRSTSMGMLWDIAMSIARNFRADELYEFGEEFLSKTLSETNPDRIYATFKELLFKFIFLKRYRAFHQKITAGMLKRAFDEQAVVVSVAMRYLESLT